MYRFLLLIVGGALGLALHAHPQATVSWTNATGGDWSVATNWSTGSVPGPTDDVVIDLAGTYTVTLDVNASVNSLTLGGSSGTQTLSASSRTLTLADSSTVRSRGRLGLSSTTVDGTGEMVNYGDLALGFNNRIHVDLENRDTLTVSSYNTQIKGSFYNATGSLLWLPIRNNNSVELEFDNGFVNDGRIELTDIGSTSSSRYATLRVFNDSLINNGVIRSEGNQGARTLFLALDNNGTFEVDYRTTLEHGSVDHHNTGTITLNDRLTVDGNAWFRHEAGTITSTGTADLYVNTSKIFFVPATMPDVPLYLNQSTFDGAVALISQNRIRIGFQNTLAASLTNGDTVEVLSYNSTWTGNFYNAIGALLWLPIRNNNSVELEFDNGFVNDGRIELTDIGSTSSSRYATLRVFNDSLINNGVIRSEGDQGARTLFLALDNNGTFEVDYRTTLEHGSVDHHNTGTITLNDRLTVDGNAWFRHEAGTITSTGTADLYVNTSKIFFVPATMPDVPLYLNQSTFDGATTLTSQNRIQIGFTNTIDADLTNGDTVEVISYNSTWTGDFYNPSGSLLWLPIRNNGYSQLTFSQGWINDGRIELTDIGSTFSSRYATLRVLNDSLTNNGTIRVEGDQGTRTLFVALDNNGTFEVDFPTTLEHGSVDHHNTGTITLNDRLTIDGNAWFRHEAGTITSTGTADLYVNTSKIFFVPATMPDVPLYLNQSTFDGATTLTSQNRIQIGFTNTIDADLTNGDTVEVISYNSTWTGDFYNPSGSLLWLPIRNNGYSQLTFSQGWINDGRIELTDIGSTFSSRYATLRVLNDSLTNNGTIRVEGDQGTRTLFVALDNNGTFEVDYRTTLEHGSVDHHNTGTITLNDRLTIDGNAWFRHEAGTITSTGTADLYVNTSKIFFVPATMPDVPLYLNQSTFDGATTLTSQNRIQIGFTNTIDADLTNGDTVEVISYNSTWTGDFYNPVGSLLWLPIRNNGYSELDFTNGFVNDGRIELTDIGTTFSSRYATLRVVNDSLTNNGVIRSEGDQGTRTLFAALDNNGTFEVDYRTTLEHGSVDHHNTGTITLNDRLTIDGNAWFRHEAGTITSTGTADLYVNTSRIFFVPATMPDVQLYLNQSTFDGAVPLTSQNRIRIGLQNTIDADLTNGDTVEVISYNSTWTGDFYNPSGSLLWLPIRNNGYSELDFTNGFVNDGRIELTDIGSTFSSRYATLRVLNDSLTNNGTIRVEGDQGTRTLFVALDNNGTFEVDYPTTLEHGSVDHHNTGTINLNERLTIDGNAWFRHEAGTITSTGTADLYVNTSRIFFVPATMPDVQLYLNQSTFDGAVPLTNQNRIRIGLQNTIDADLTNGDTVEVLSYNSVWTGEFYNPVDALLWLPIRNNGYSQITFNQRLVNDGNIELTNIGAASSSRYARLFVAGDTLVNNGTISVGGTSGSRGFSGVIQNNGTFEIERSASLTGDFINTAGGTFRVHLDGTTVNSNYFQLAMNGTARLGGTLDIQRDPGFTPALGQTFTIMPYGARVDTFFTVLNRQISGNQAFLVDYTPTAVVLQADTDPCAGAAVPTVQATSNVVCVGDSVQLDTDPGFVAYRWLFNDNDTVATTKSFYAKQGGYYRIEAEDGVGCVVRSQAFALNSRQIFVTLGPDTLVLCSGQSLNLIASHPLYSGINSYLWNTSATSQQITVTAAGQYDVRVEDIYGCKAFDTVEVVSRPTPAATINAGSATTFCLGDSVVLNANTGSGLTYLWSTGATTPSITVKNGGSYQVVVSNEFCSKASNSVQVQANDPLLDFGANARNFYLPNGTANFASLTSGTIASYAWDFGDGGSATTPGPSHAYTTPGFYTVELTVEDNAGCRDSITKTEFILVWEVLNNNPRPLPGGDTSTVVSSFFWSGDSGCVVVLGDGGGSNPNPSGGSTIYITYNGGTSYTAIYPPGFSGDFTDVYRVGNRIYVTGTGGHICFYDLTTGTWTVVSGLPNVTFTSTWFGINGNGWAVGANGSTYYWNGSIWTPFNTGVTNTFYGVYSYNQRNAWIVGSGGIICYWDGSQWVPQSSGVTDTLYSVSFADSLNGYACGANGTLLCTTDGGQSWTKCGPSYDYDLYGCFAVSPDYCVTVGNNGVVMITTDGGINWNLFSIGTDCNLRDVYVVGCTAYITGENGRVYQAALPGCSGSTLPVTLLSFHGTAFESGIQLDWYATESGDADRYRLSRSSDGTMWEVLTEVEATGFAGEPAFYEWIDARPLPGRNLYRLQEITVDGSLAFLGTVELWWRDAEPGLRVYPNPARDRVFVETTDQPLTGSLSVHDISGKQLRTFAATPQRVAVDLAGLPPGIYLLRIRFEGGRESWQRVRKE